MVHILEYGSYFKDGDVVVIEYWYNGMLTPVKIVGAKKGSFLVSHDVEQSKIRNAPDEWVRKSDVIDKYQLT
jgi:hypothetical protein